MISPGLPSLACVFIHHSSTSTHEPVLNTFSILIHLCCEHYIFTLNSEPTVKYRIEDVNI